MGKIEKLREVNSTITEMLLEFETRLFLQDIVVDNNITDYGDIKVKTK